jgi:hypothetical protein
MGRPIKKRYLGTTVGGASLAGGEGISSINITAKGNNYSQGATITVAVSPIGGTRATGTVTPYTPQQFANLSITSTAVTEAGTGYLTAPAVTLVKPANVTVSSTAFSGNLAGNILTVSTTTGLFVGMHQNQGNLAPTAHILAIFTNNSNVIMSRGVSSTYSNQTFQFGDVGTGATFTTTLVAAVTTGNTIQANAWTATSTIGQTADIVAQKGSRRYRVTNATETDVVRLIKSTEVGAANTAGGPPSAGLMTITATDSASGTYWVTKIDSRTCTLTPGGSAPGAQFAANAQVIWSMNAAVVSTTVKLATND